MKSLNNKTASNTLPNHLIAPVLVHPPLSGTVYKARVSAYMLYKTNNLIVCQRPEKLAPHVKQNK